MIQRSKERIRKTGEVFTPHELCIQIVRDIPKEKLSNPTTTYLDSSCGDGNFLCALYQVLTQDYGHTSEKVMDRLYGVELMPDNVEIARARLPGAHIVCADALTYDYSFT